MRRGKLPEGWIYSNREIVRRAKKWAGWTGMRCRVEHYGDLTAIYPRGICQVVFATWAEKSDLPVVGE